MEQIVKKLANLYGDEFGTGFAGNVRDSDYLCPTLMTAQGGGRVPMVVIQIDDSNSLR